MITNAQLDTLCTLYGVAMRTIFERGARVAFDVWLADAAWYKKRIEARATPAEWVEHIRALRNDYEIIRANRQRFADIP